MVRLRRQHRGPAGVSRVWTAVELLVGIALLGAAALAGLLFARRPGQDRVDAAGYFYLPERANTHLASELVKMGSLPVLLVGIGVIFASTVFRDWLRALACSLAPLIAVGVVEHVAKPMVGRRFGSGGFTYPSGTVAAIAALATALFLVSPRLLRPLSVIAGSLAVAAVGWAVLVLKWHYPTDVVGGIWVGCGSVLLIDALARLLRIVGEPRRSHDPAVRSAAMGPPLHA